MQAVYRAASGRCVLLLPETVVTPNGMYGPHCASDPIETLRGAHPLGNTPMLLNRILPPRPQGCPLEARESYLRHARLLETLIRPLLASVRVYRHAPVSATRGVEPGDWFALELMAPERTGG